MRNHLPTNLTFTLVLCLLLISCGAPTQNQRGPIPSVTSSRPISSASSASSTMSLPPTADIDFSGLRLLEVVFRTQLNVSRLDDLYATTRGKVQNLSLVSNCDLNVLKGFVATGWAPIVFMHAGGRRLWAIVGYNEQQILTENPISRVVRNLNYSDFEKEWTTGSGQKCVLITPGKLNEARVHAVLQKYLPAGRFSQVKVRSR